MTPIFQGLAQAVCLGVAGFGFSQELQMVTFHGIRPGDTEGRDGLPNPERGFRLEALIADGKEPGWTREAQKWSENGITLVQTYCYLQESANAPIPAEKLEALQQSFDELREHGMKAVLRFAYESRREEQTGPTLEVLRGHIRQLQPVIQTNIGLIHVLQAGMIGLWGEWHHSVHGLDQDEEARKTLVADWLATLPKERMLQVRRAEYKRITLGDGTEASSSNAFGGSPASRVGFHHDFFVVRQNGWDTSPGTPDFDQVTRESPYLMVDGEMPWAGDAGGDEPIDGLEAAVRLHLHHYTSFSFAHNNHEHETAHAITRWMKTPLTAVQLHERHLPVSDGYFEAAADPSAPRTEFEYIRDHLGYRLELQQASFPKQWKTDEELPASLSLINRGFATLCNPRPVLLVLISDRGDVCEIPTGADPRTWQPYAPEDHLSCAPLVHTLAIKAKPSTALTPGLYRFGLWLPDGSPALRYDAHYAVRCANRDAVWWVDKTGRHGVNVLGEIAVVK